MIIEGAQLLAAKVCPFLDLLPVWTMRKRRQIAQRDPRGGRCDASGAVCFFCVSNLGPM
jgi:hypothetical protein